MNMGPDKKKKLISFALVFRCLYLVGDIYDINDILFSIFLYLIIPSTWAAHYCYIKIDIHYMDTLFNFPQDWNFRPPGGTKYNWNINKFFMALYIYYLGCFYLVWHSFLTSLYTSYYKIELQYKIIKSEQTS